MSAFASGDAVQYYSDSRSCWMDTTVQATRPTGEVQLSCKPGIWISRDDQKTKVRASLGAPARGGGGYRPVAPGSQGPWAVEQAVALGHRSANQLGARKPEELAWATVLDSVTSVHAAVEQLNSGSVACSSDFCVVYSASSSSHYLLFKKGQRAAHVQSASLAAEKEHIAKLQRECESLRSTAASLEKRLQEETVLREAAQASQLQADSGKMAFREAAQDGVNLQHECENLRSANASLERRLQEETSLREAAQAKLLQAEGERAALEARASFLEAQASSKQAASASVGSASLAEVQEKLFVEMERRAQLERDAAGSDAIKRGLERQLKETNKEIDELQEQVNRVDDERAAKDALATKLTIVEEEIRALRSQSRSDDATNLKVELERERESRILLMAKLTATEDEIRLLKDAAAQNERDKRLEVERGQEKLLQANEVLSNSRRALEQQLCEETARCANLEAVITDLRGRLGAS